MGACAPVNERHWHSFVIIESLCRVHLVLVSERVHRRIRTRLRRLTRAEVAPAEARRLVRPLSGKLGLPPPSYSSVLRIMTAERRRLERRLHEPGVLDSLVLGRFPTPRELEGSVTRALEHKQL